MPILSEAARSKKIAFFLKNLPKNSRILEIGSKDGWVGEYLKSHGFRHYETIDLVGPADYVGDIKNYKMLGLVDGTYDVVVAFEVIEHVDCSAEINALLSENGVAFLTSPAPKWDWLCFFLEFLGLNQKRTSSHSNLVDFSKDLSPLKPILVKRIALMAQWGIFKKSTNIDKPSTKNSRNVAS